MLNPPAEGTQSRYEPVSEPGAPYGAIRVRRRAVAGEYAFLPLRVARVVYILGWTRIARIFGVQKRLMYGWLTQRRPLPRAEIEELVCQLKLALLEQVAELDAWLNYD